ncbi:MAG: nitronate monooxygenase [Actinomycetota bacterium]|nr:nitronate monooxygenase [Actinomycetota bacterium]
MLDQLRLPIVQAPLAGGSSTPALAAAVANAGGLGFLAAGYKRAETVQEDLHALRALTGEPIGVNIFAAPAPLADPALVSGYAAELQAEAEHFGVELGAPRHDDDDLEAKLELVTREQVAVVSFTFGCPTRAVLDRLRAAGCEAWVTVTSPTEALEAERAGADAVVVQGFEAGGHRGYFADAGDNEDLGLLALLRLVRRALGLPLVAAGGIADGASIAAVLAAGAAAQVGTALMLTPEAGTAPAHRAALRSSDPTALTRAYSGRQARGVVNRFMREHGGAAPRAYPEVHHLTSPIRAAARAAGNPEALNLFAGQAHSLASEAPAADVIARLAADARAAAAALQDRLGPLMK